MSTRTAPDTTTTFARRAAGGALALALAATLTTTAAPAEASTVTSGTPTAAAAAAPQASALTQGRIASGGFHFGPGKRLAVNQYRFVFQADGNAVVYGNGRALFVIRTHGLARGGKMVMQSDGNLVIYRKNGRPIWSSRTHGKAAGGRLVLQSDGHLVIYSRAGKAVWSNRRAGANVLTPGSVLGPGHYIQAHGSRARLIMHANGTLEQVAASGRSMWKRHFPAGSRVKMWADGSLAAYAPNGQRVWRAPGAGSRGARTVIQRNDRLVTYSTTRSKLVTPLSSIVTTLSSPHATAVFNQLNAERARNGVHQLRLNAKLTAAAHGHNLAMAKADDLTHQVAGEAGLSSRIKAKGYQFSYAAENVGMNPDTSVAGALQLESIMYNQKAPNDGHRRNILSRNYTEVGIDVHISGGKLWLTQNFARPR